jgi:putative molybdopterin biosynthesis protein
MAQESALTPQEVADLLKITKNTVYQLIKRGELNSYKVGKKIRIDMSDVEAYKNKDRVKAASKALAPENQIFQQLAQDSFNYQNRNNEDALVICGQDVCLDILSRYLEIHPQGARSLRSYVGSYAGLYELYNGNAQVATVHLWDAESDSYNVPYVKYMLPATGAVIVHLAKRNQGFYVKEGNPKKIYKWQDIARRDVALINREKGSGSRVLLDQHLKKLGIDGREINGYNRESVSHLAVASTIARGGADVGIGNEKAAQQVKGIDFVFLQEERYELVFKKEDMQKPPFQAILSILNSEEFRLELQGIGGYDLSELGSITALT